MLPEALLYLTAATTPSLRKLGLVGDAVALWSRASRRARAWQPHEARSRAFVADLVPALTRRRTALVLGSGLVRDVPLDLLCGTFRRVVLVDAVHLWPARLRARGAGAEIAVADLSGVAAWLAGEAEGRTEPLADFRRGDVDLVVSANLLSQLWRAPARWLDRHSAAALPADLPARIVRGHLADLAAFDAVTCLVTDTSYAEVSRTGAVAEPEDALCGMTLPPPDAAWDWEVAPRGEVGRGVAYRHRVGAWRDIGAALRYRPAP